MRKILFKREVIHIYLRTLGLLILLPAVLFAAYPPEIPDGWSDGYVVANGIRIHYYHADPAPGKPVILAIHGVMDTGLAWASVAGKLQDNYDIYMLDTRGHGLSDSFTSSDDSNTLLRDVVMVAQKLGLEKPILMGHSMGAATVMRLGAEYPDLVKAIIMLDPFLGRRGPARWDVEARREGEAEAGRETPQREASVPDRLSVSMRGTPEALVAQNNYDFDDLVAKCSRQTPKWDIVDCQYWALSKKQYHGAYTDETWQAMSGTMRTEGSLAKIPVPALILKADASPEQRKANEEAANVMQKGKLVHVDGTGHNLHHDDLERTVEVLTEFLSVL